ncbi:MAG: helix-turn-helix transcriptional regulator [Steroidobacteraceae bacterium]
MSKQLRTARHRRVMVVLAAIRTEAGVTQRELARRLNRAHSYVSRIEMGDRRLDVPEMIQWCEVLDSDPVDVMKRIMRRSSD